MRLFHQSLLLLPSFLAYTCATYADSYQSLQLALTQQSQLFEFEVGEKTLNVQGFRLDYQYGFNNWRFSADYSQSEGDDSGTRPQYEFSFKNSGYSAFAEYNWSSIWLALGYSFSEDKTGFSFKPPDIQGGFIVDAGYQNYILDTGYIYATHSGQWTASGSLTHQLIDETKQAHSIQQGSSENQNNTQIEESAWLASLGVNYNHYFELSEFWELSIGAGLNHQLTIEGEGKLQQSSMRRTAISTNQNSTTEVLTDNQSSSTSQQFQMSLLHRRGSINLGIDKLSNQSIDDAYFSLGLGLNFE